MRERQRTRGHCVCLQCDCVNKCMSGVGAGTCVHVPGQGMQESLGTLLLPANKTTTQLHPHTHIHSHLIDQDLARRVALRPVSNR